MANANVVIGELRPGASEKVLCRADMTLFGCLTIVGACLYKASNGDVCLGMPQRNYQQADGKTKYEDVIRLTEAAKGSLRERLFDAYLASDIPQQVSVAEPGDPFA